MLGLAFQTNAQVWNYKSTEFAIKSTNSYGNWTEWSDWQKSDCNIVLDGVNDRVTIYSPKTQIYRITSIAEKAIDKEGCVQTSFKVEDQDADIGTIRFRITTNGVLQLYIDFANIAWVYNIIKQ